MSRLLRVGLVLTGGGAEAAYQVGVIQAIAEKDIEITAVSAVGSGALNGAIVAGAETTREAAVELAKVWHEVAGSAEAALQIGPVPVLRLGAYLTLLFALGLSPKVHEHLKNTAGSVHRTFLARRLAELGQGFSSASAMIGAAIELVNVTTDDELKGYLSSSLGQALNNVRRPFFVSVYEHGGTPLHALRDGLQFLGLLEASTPQYIDVSASDLTGDERLGAVLASSAIPFVCDPIVHQGKCYVDGSFGGLRRSLGAVPLQPLRRSKEIDVDVILVVHTEPGVTWNSSQFPDTTVLEIRPSGKPKGNMGYFWANPGSMKDWIEQGKRDTQEKLETLLAAIDGDSVANEARENLRKAADWL